MTARTYTATLTQSEGSYVVPSTINPHARTAMRAARDRMAQVLRDNAQGWPVTARAVSRRGAWLVSFETAHGEIFRAAL